MQEQTPLNKTKNTDLFLVDPRNIIADPSHNVRIDMGDIEEMLNSILEIGIQIPLKAKKIRGTEQYSLVDGFRRHTAIMLGLERGHDIPFVPLTPFKGNEEDEVICMLVTGTGQKSLNEVEQAEAIKRLINYGYSATQIAGKVGKSIPHIYQLISIGDLPKPVKERIMSGHISAKAAAEIAKLSDNREEIIEMVEGAIENAQSYAEEGKIKKATAKNISSEAKKASPAKQLNLLVKEIDSTGVKTEKTEWFMELVAEMKAGASIEELMKKF